MCATATHTCSTGPHRPFPRSSSSPETTHGPAPSPCPGSFLRPPERQTSRDTSDEELTPRGEIEARWPTQRRPGDLAVGDRVASLVEHEAADAVVVGIGHEQLARGAER